MNLETHSRGRTGADVPARHRHTGQAPGKMSCRFRCFFKMVQRDLQKMDCMDQENPFCIELEQQV